MPRFAPPAIAALLAAALLGASPAGAVPGPDPGTGSTTTAPPHPDGDVAGGRPPTEEVEVPEPEGGEAVGREASEAIVGDLASAEDRVARADHLVRAAVTRVTNLRDELAAVDGRIEELAVEQQRAIRRVERAQQRMAERAVGAYVRGNLNGLEAIMQSEDPNELSQNTELMGSVLDADEQAVEDYIAARAQLSVELIRVVEERRAVERDLRQAKSYEEIVRADAADARVQLAAFEAGSQIFVTGMVFPVDDPHDFIDSFGFPRSGGRSHQGADIFAPRGTALFAVERGVVTNMGTNSLGGIKLWLHGESGTQYYYAHLQGFAPGITDGTVVNAGDLVGFVGDTGNARGTPPHLHFEIHPNGGPAVNPAPLLFVVDRLDGGAPPGNVPTA
jgi:murein DD-endopeptidase MepM/ murein hydrolase activator NlpD